MMLEDKAIEYFKIFSKFEYALLRAGYFIMDGACTEKDDDGKLKCSRSSFLVSNWGRLKKEISDKIKLQEFKEVSDDVAYLIENPPRKRVIKPDGQLGWSDQIPIRSVSDAIDACKRIRNNLIHGNKYKDEPDADDENRNFKLLNGALGLLNMVLEHSPDVKLYYDDAALEVS